MQFNKKTIPLIKAYRQAIFNRAEAELAYERAKWEFKSTRELDNAKAKANQMVARCDKARAAYFKAIGVA